MDLPLRHDLTIAQRATFRERIQLPIDCTDRDVIAQVWTVRSGKRVSVQLTFTVEWIDRALSVIVTDDNGDTSTVTYGDFYLVGNWEETTTLQEPAQWDLLVVEGPSLERAGERSYWLEGLVTVNQGLSQAGAI